MLSSDVKLLTEKIPVLKEIGKLGLNAIKGLANWIGLGDYISDKIVEGAGLNEVWDKLEAQITDKLNKGQITLDELQSRLNNLDAQGFNLTGRAAEAWSKAKNDLRDKIRYQTKQNAESNVKAQLAQAKIDRAKTEAREWGNTSDVMDSTVPDIENIIGGMK